MQINFRDPLVTAFFAVALTPLAIIAAGRPASAQALPTAPAADRASIGGTTGAAASLPGPNASPLEPYLVSWLLPVGGLLSVIVAAAADRRVRGSASAGFGSVRPRST